MSMHPATKMSGRNRSSCGRLLWSPIVVLLFALMGNGRGPVGFVTHALIPPLPVAKSVLSKMIDIPRSNPRAFAITVATIKASAADTVAQKIEISRQKKKLNNNDDTMKFDFRRVSVFAVYGAAYLGWWQHFLFASIYTRLFPLASAFAAKSLQEKLVDRAGMVAVLQQVGFEALVHWPWLYIPAYYVLKELGSKAPSFSSLKASMKKNWSGDVALCYKVWIPAMIFNFSTLPLWLQVPFTGVVGFAYIITFSMRRGADDG